MSLTSLALPERPLSLRSLLMRPVTRALVRPAVNATAPQERRTRLEHAARMTNVFMPAGSDLRSGMLGDVKVEWVANTRSGAHCFVLYLHGGAYTHGSALVYRALTLRLAQKASACIAALDYRLAPEHPFPAAVEDALNAYRAMLDQGIKPAKIVFAGDSAGAGLALACALWAKSGGLPLPAGIYAICPWADLSLSGASSNGGVADDLVLTREVLAEAASVYLKREDPRNPLASPLFADLTGLPPLLIQATDGDLLVDDARRLAGAADAQGVAVTYEEWKGLWHVWQGLAGWLPEADQALARAADFIKARTA